MANLSVWMPLYYRDFLARTARLTTQQIGAYMLLQIDYWTNGAIPDDDAILAQITRLPRADWERMRASVSDLFAIADRHGERDGERIGQRVWSDTVADALKQRQTKIVDARTAAAVTTNAKRWGKTSVSDTVSESVTDTVSESQSESVSGRKSKSKVKSKEKTEAKAETTLPESAKSADSSSSGDALDGPDSGLEFALSSVVDAKSEAVREIFGHYLAAVNRDGAAYSLTRQRKQKGLARLADALRITHGNLQSAVSLMKCAVDELAASDFHMGRMEKSDGRRYCEWEKHLFKNTEQFETWLQPAMEERHV